MGPLMRLCGPAKALACGVAIQPSNSAAIQPKTKVVLICCSLPCIRRLYFGSIIGVPAMKTFCRVIWCPNTEILWVSCENAKGIHIDVQSKECSLFSAFFSYKVGSIFFGAGLFHRIPEIIEFAHESIGFLVVYAGGPAFGRSARLPHRIGRRSGAGSHAGVVVQG